MGNDRAAGKFEVTPILERFFSRTTAMDALGVDLKVVAREIYIVHESAVEEEVKKAVEKDTEELKEKLRLTICSNKEYRNEVDALKSGEHPAIKKLIAEEVKKAVDAERDRCARIADHCESFWEVL